MSLRFPVFIMITCVAYSVTAIVELSDAAVREAGELELYEAIP
ncbi:MAG: hypothetical protein AB9903_23815 [Vulcanimicrobiota bacterium]